MELMRPSSCIMVLPSNTRSSVVQFSTGSVWLTPTGLDRTESHGQQKAGHSVTLGLAVQIEHDLDVC